jgi:4-amino-4-deoxy-L-arabinose transferase-like glycosyltransferase
MTPAPRVHRLRQCLASPDARQVAAVMFLATAILWNQIENEVFYSVDDIVYALVAKELTGKPLLEWVVLTWFQAPFYEHPHLTPWLLGVSMALLGVGTTAAIVPIVVLSMLTVLLTYVLGRCLLDHRYGLLAATTLTLTPQFVAGGRNPMLEPALMLCIMLAIYCHLKAAESTRHACSALMGLALGLAVLAKGPAAALAVAVVVGFQGMARLLPGPFARFRAPRGWLVVHLSCAAVACIALLALVDVWHQAVAGKSFFAHYAAEQWKRTVLDRGRSNDLGYYAKVFLRYWPWLPLVLAGPPLVVWRRDWAAAPASTVGALVTGGTFLGFTLLAHKAFWYVAIHYVGSSLLAALTLRYVAPESWMRKRFAQCCAIGATAMLGLSAAFPSLFVRDSRPRETFFQRAAPGLGNRLEGTVVADCVNVGQWRAPFLFRFHLGATKTHCDDANATFKVVDDRKTYGFDRGDYRVLYSRYPFSIIELTSHR